MANFDKKQSYPIYIVLLSPIISVYLAFVESDLAMYFLALGLDIIFISLFLILMAILHFFKMPKENYSIVEHHKWSILAWVVILICAFLPYLLLPEHFDGSLIRLLITLLVISVGVSLYYLLTRLHKDTAHNILILLIGYHAVYVLFFLFIISFGFYTQPDPEAHYRLFPGYGNIRVIAQILSPMIVAGTFLFARKSDNTSALKIILQFGALSFLWSLLLWSGSRGGVLAAIVSFALIYLIIKRRNGHYLKVFLLTMIAGVALTFIYPEPQSGMGLERLYKKALVSKNVGELSSSRTDVWAAAIQNIKENPIIGYGMAGFTKTAHALGQKIQHPHNLFLGQSHSMGMIGASVLVLWLLITWVKIYNSLRKNKSTTLIASAAGMTTLSIQSLYDGILFHYQSLFILVIFFSISVYLYNSEKQLF